MPQVDGNPSRPDIRSRASSAPPTSVRVRELSARPVCSVCGKPVERMTEEEDDYGDGRVTFTAFCHGQREAIAIPMGDARLKGITFGAAFASSPRRIEAP